MVNEDLHDSADDADDEVDARLRGLAQSLPATKSPADLQPRVVAKIRRRKLATRAAWAASLLALLSAGWAIIAASNQSQQPLAGNNKPPVEHQGIKNSSSAAASDVELFASAYQGLPSPVAELETIESESEALLSYLDSLEDQENP